MNPGALRHRVTIQKPREGQSRAGQPVQEWDEVATVWAAVEPLRGREYWAAAQVQAEATTRVRIRYRKGIRPDMRVVYGGRIFQIVAPPIDPEERHREIHLMCKEVF